MADKTQEAKDNQKQGYRALLNSVIAEAFANPSQGKLKNWAENFAQQLEVEGSKNNDSQQLKAELEAIGKLEAEAGQNKEKRYAVLNALGAFIDKYGLEDSVKNSGILLKELTQADSARRAEAGKADSVKTLKDRVEALAGTGITAHRSAVPPPAPAVGTTADADKKKAEAKTKLEQAKVRHKQLRDIKNPTEAQKVDLQKLEAEMSDLFKAAGESEWIYKAEVFFGDLKSGNFNWGTAVGGIGGAILGLFGASLAGGIFGEGILGTILKFALVIPLAMFGAKWLGEQVGGGSDKSAAGGPGQSRGGPVQGKSLMLSISEVERCHAEAVKKGFSDKYFAFGYDSNGVFGLLPVYKTANLAGVQNLVSVDVLRQMVAEQSRNNPNQPVRIEAVDAITRTYNAGMQSAAAAAAQSRGEAPVRRDEEKKVADSGQKKPADEKAPAATGNETGFWTGIRNALTPDPSKRYDCVDMGVENNGQLPGSCGYPGANTRQTTPAATR